MRISDWSSDGALPICAEFSFLLALPVMTATTGYELIKHYQYFTDEGLVMLGAGFVTAFIVARLTMRWFIRFLARFTFVSFGVYRILLGLALLIWFADRKSTRLNSSH